jgi:Ca-activated chloride channel family protein
VIGFFWPRGTQLASPLALALLAVPLALLVLELRRRRRGAAISALPGGGRLPASWRTRLLWLPPVLRFLSLSLLVVALARPQQGVGRVESTADAVAIELVVDRSGSMAQLMPLDGVNMPRMDVVKRVVHDFLLGNEKDLGGRHSDLVGLVAFGDYAETICPPVRDPATVARLAESVQVANEHTALGDGLALAAARLHTAEQDLKNRTDASKYEQLRIKSKVVILLTDGANNYGEQRPEEAAKLAKDWGVKVYTIGLGAGVDSVQVVTDMLGNQHRIARPSDCDEPSLRRIADMTGGVYRRAQDGESLRNIYKEIDQLEKTSIKTVEYVDYNERFMAFAAAGGALAVAGSVLGATLLRRALA